jgi:TDG/mug DNA glycosylase family protein
VSPASAPGRGGEIKHAFAPIAPPNARILILGTLPGEASLAAAQYYAHPQNAFWRLLGDLTGRPFATLAYADRLTALAEARVALWDTIASARRPGSLDGAIRDHAPADLAALVQRLPDLRAVGFNGKLSDRLGRAALGTTRLALIALPSSSPAHTLAYAEKREAWRALFAFLD